MHMSRILQVNSPPPPRVQERRIRKKERKNSNKPNRPTDEAVINLANMIISGVLLLAAMHLRRVTVQDFSKVLHGFCCDIILLMFLQGMDAILKFSSKMWAEQNCVNYERTRLIYLINLKLPRLSRNHWDEECSSMDYLRCDLRNNERARGSKKRSHFGRSNYVCLCARQAGVRV